MQLNGIGQRIIRIVFCVLHLVLGLACMFHGIAGLGGRHYIKDRLGFDIHLSKLNLLAFSISLLFIGVCFLSSFIREAFRDKLPPEKTATLRLLEQCALLLGVGIAIAALVVAVVSR